MARILIAEDDAAMRPFLALALTRAGHSVETRENGLDALAALEDGQAFDLLLSDIVMPGMDGIELAHRAADLFPAMKIMFITGFAAIAGDQNRGDGDDGAPKILAKPFHLKDLVDRVAQLLAA